MAEMFTNSARGAIASAISSSDTTITLSSIGEADRFASGGSGDFQRATLVGADESVFEIVFITSKDGVDLTVERGQEGTSSLAWPPDTKLEARVTAEMLGTFMRLGDDGVLRTPGTAPAFKFVVNGRSDANNAPVQISGYPSLQKLSATPTTSAGSFIAQDHNMTHEAVGASMNVDLGDAVPVWVSNGLYTEGSIVAPPTPNGYNYVFQSLDGWQYSQTTTTPAFSGDEYSNDALDGADIVGLWVPIPTPLIINLNFPGEYGLVLSEVGFICTNHSASTVPSISVGTAADPTQFVDSVALSDAAAAASVHRFPITAGGAMLSGLRFTLATPATGRLIGRFYWRGFFVQR